MSQFLDYIIIGLFLVFCIYFVYVLLDTFYLSRRKRHVRKSPSGTKVKEAKKTEDEERTESSLDSPDPSDSSDSSGPTSHKNQSSGSETAKGKKVPHPANRTKKRNILSSLNLIKRIKSSQATGGSDVKKVDEQYYDILRKFFTKTNGSWAKDKFYEMFSDLTEKGYDKRPSEVKEDLEIIRKEFDEERRVRMEANMSDKSSDSTEEDDSSDHKDKKDVESEAKSSPESPSAKDLNDAEDELKEKMKESKKDTREELDKTLKEIREIRERLSKFEESDKQN